MNTTNISLGVLSLLGIVSFIALYFRNKASVDQTLLNTLPTKEKLADLAGTVETLEAELTQQTTVQNLVSSTLKTEETKKVSNEELQNFFNTNLTPRSK